jgi:hypothetical protein
MMALMRVGLLTTFEVSHFTDSNRLNFRRFFIWEGHLPRSGLVGMIIFAQLQVCLNIHALFGFCARLGWIANC